jgi:hypothetical protein
VTTTLAAAIRAAITVSAATVLKQRGIESPGLANELGGNAAQEIVTALEEAFETLEAALTRNA